MENNGFWRFLLHNQIIYMWNAIIICAIFHCHGFFSCESQQHINGASTGYHKNESREIFINWFLPTVFNGITYIRDLQHFVVVQPLMKFVVYLNFVIYFKIFWNSCYNKFEKKNNCPYSLFEFKRFRILMWLDVVENKEKIKKISKVLCVSRDRSICLVVSCSWLIRFSLPFHIFRCSHLCFWYFHNISATGNLT